MTAAAGLPLPAVIGLGVGAYLTVMALLWAGIHHYASRRGGGR